MARKKNWNPEKYVNVHKEHPHVLHILEEHG